MSKFSDRMAARGIGSIDVKEAIAKSGTNGPTAAPANVSALKEQRVPQVSSS